MSMPVCHYSLSQSLDHVHYNNRLRKGDAMTSKTIFPNDTDHNGEPFAPASKSVLFVVQRRSGIWNVTRDGVFFGDFVEEKNALEAAQTAGHAIFKAGGRAEITFGPIHRG